MIRISDIRIGTKLAVMSVSSILLVIGLASSQFYMEHQISTVQKDATRQLHIAYHAADAKASMRGMIIGMRDIRLAISEDQLNKADEFNKARRDAVVASVDKMLGLAVGTEERARIERMKAETDSYLSTLGTMRGMKTKAFAAISDPDAFAALNGEVDLFGFQQGQNAANAIAKTADEIVAGANKAADAAAAQVARSESTAYRVGIALAVLSVLLNFGMAIFGRLSIARPLSKLVEPIDQLADGKFDIAISGVGRKDEVGHIATAVHAMAERVRQTLTDIKRAALEVNNASGEISTGTTDLSQRTEEQAASLEETSAAMEEISATVKRSAENADQASKSAQQAHEVAAQGGQVVAHAVDAMAKIEESSRKISDIISVIDEIARQTNLLALNAAVEAARAGEAGRGFAVVATEVRSLAQRSSQAAKDIKELITNSNGQVKDGVDLVNRAGEALTRIVESVKEVAVLVSDIATASTEQATGLDQINRTLAQMDEVTQQNAALVEENAATAKALETQAQVMDERVAFFKLDGGDTRRAAKVTSPVTATAPAKPSEAPVKMAKTKVAANPVRAMRSNLATALKAEEEWKDF